MIATKPASHYKCKNRCGDQAQYYAGTTPICSSGCAYEHVMKKKAAKKKKADIAYRAETRKMAVDIRTRTGWYKILEDQVNAYVKFRDHDKLCVTCTTANQDSFFHAGHYLSVGASKPTRFNLINIHKQCAQCNKFGGGERDRYRIFMVKTYGENVVLDLEGPQPSLKEIFPTTQDIEFEINQYKEINKDMKKWLNLK